jgi:hypothetical protein
VSKSLQRDGFPPMSDVAQVSAAPSSSSKHQPASVKICDFRVMEDVPPVRANFNSTLWNFFTNRNVEKFPLCTEADISTLVELAVTDMICEIGWQEKVQVVREKQGFSWEPDLTIVSGCHPIGGVEIKKGLKEDENETVVGEVFDQLMHFKHHWGNQSSVCDSVKLSRVTRMLAG